MTGEFTYDSYLAHLVEREQRCRAEIAGFIDARTLDYIGKYGIPELDESYQVGFHIGKMYLTKGEELKS